jgi:anaerobic magnesium-protoporphyrin IX monomethyl ester cyclase
MRPKILLLDPPHKIFGALRMWTPSPGLMALAAYLEAKGIETDFLDATLLKRPWTDLKAQLKEKRYDIVGITCSAATFHWDAVYAVRWVRQALPEAVIIGGGGHMTLNAETILNDISELDYIIMGEGEETLLELIQWLHQKRSSSPDNIRGLSFRKNGKLRTTPSRPLIKNMDSLPFPAYHKAQIDHQVYHLHGMGHRAVGISTSRGCEDHCAYCSESRLWHANWRGRSGPLVLEEMNKLHRDYGKSLFVFNENSFNQVRERNEAFLENLGRSGARYDFWFQSRIKDILRDRDLLADFKRLGCYEVMLGIESILPETLQNYSKKQTLEEAQEAAELLRSHGIMVMTNIMFGDIHETETTLKRTYDFVSRIGDFLVLTITTPLPGTPYYYQAVKDGRIEEHDFQCYDFMHPIMSNAAHTRKEIVALQKKYLKKYYTRPSIFAKMLFSTNRFKRMAYRLIMRYAWYEARNREWVQRNYETVPPQLRAP